MIEVFNVSKKFKIWEDRSQDFKETTINFLKGKRRSFRELWALRDLSLKIREGETVAFVGENGSGKSTLLKLLCGIYVPDKGEIVTHGRVSALLELGVGFHPDLTGEENIYLNGSMLGFNRREMKKRFDEIVSFSEISDFIYSPIRTYSSGMVMRLGFSIAMCVDPDILIIDEILAVGDEAFQKKCLGRLEEFKSAGKTIIIVSHALDLIEKFCERAILLRHGQLVADGVPEETIERYRSLFTLKEEVSQMDGPEIAGVGGKGVPSPGEEDTVTEEGAEFPPPSLKDDEQVEKDIMRPEESFEEFHGNGLSEGESEIKLEQERLRIIEVQDSEFFSGKLFFNAFGQPPPTTPTNYAAIYMDSKNPSIFYVLGFIHMERIGEMGLVGGLCIEQRWQGKGLGKILLNFVDNRKNGIKAFFVYTNDSRLAMECGYEPLPHPCLMVKWILSLSPEEKERLIDAVMKIGPF